MRSTGKGSCGEGISFVRTGCTSSTAALPPATCRNGQRVRRNWLAWRSAGVHDARRTPRRSRNVPAKRGIAMSSYVKDLMSEVEARNPGEVEFHQAVREVAESV